MEGNVIWGFKPVEVLHAPCSKPLFSIKRLNLFFLSCATATAVSY